MRKSNNTVHLVIEVIQEDADAILFNDLHGNSQSVVDSGSSYPIASAETLEEYLESQEDE